MGEAHARGDRGQGGLAGMRVLLSSNHRYPADTTVGCGRQPKELPSGSGMHMHDLLARGLAKLGHEVLYLLPKGASEPLPAGVTMVREPVADVDMYHNQAYRDEDVVAYMSAERVPWVTTCHLDLRARGWERRDVTQQWIYVSRTLAQSHGSDRYVLNGIDADSFHFSREKQDYLLFLAAMDWAESKGLDTAISLASETGVRLVVAGTGKTWDVVNAAAERCRAGGAEYVGDVRGEEKAELLANARALILPTKVNEAFGLVLVEALMSGTPVICSGLGACAEIVTPDVGFVCRTRQEYLSAIAGVNSISPDQCRAKAMNEYQYTRMAADYVREYHQEIASASLAAKA